MLKTPLLATFLRKRRSSCSWDSFGRNSTEGISLTSFWFHNLLGLNKKPGLRSRRQPSQTKIVIHKKLNLPIDTLLVATISYLRKPTNASAIISQDQQPCQLKIKENLGFSIVFRVKTASLPQLALSLKDDYNQKKFLNHQSDVLVTYQKKFKEATMNDRRILFTCLVLLLVACLILSCAGIFGAGIYFWNSSSSEESAEVRDAPGINENSTAEENPSLEDANSDLEGDVQPSGIADSESTEAPSNPESEAPNSAPDGSDIDPEIAHQMDEIQVHVITERGLKPSETVDRQLYSPEQLQEKVIADFEEDYSPEEAQIEAITLASFGLLNSDFDLYNFYIDLFSEQIAGFYDQETKEMVVVQGDSFGGPERLTYAHEYTHALQDQTYDIENGLNFNDDACELDTERCAAIRALLEGDASLTELNWFFENGTPDDQAEIMEFYQGLEMPVFNSAPDFITLGFTFPYEYGYAFVEHLHNIGGWGTVDRAYHELPLSTEQIMHPERYPDDKPIQVELPELEVVLDNGWEEIDRGTMGEWDTYLILAKGLDGNARLDESDAEIAAEGWGGDSYVVYYDETNKHSVVVLQTTWDTSVDADEFAGAFRDYANARFGTSSTDTWQGDDGYHSFHSQNDTTTWILAPDAATATAVWQLISQ